MSTGSGPKASSKVRGTLKELGKAAAVIINERELPETHPKAFPHVGHRAKVQSPSARGANHKAAGHSDQTAQHERPDHHQICKAD